MRIALDAMGGDFAPAVVVAGAIEALRQLPNPPQVILVGDEDRVRAELTRHGEKASPGGPLEIRPTTEIIEMGDHPGQALRQKRDSSIRVCFELVKRGEADAMVSAGNSGAVMAGAVLFWGRLDGVERPAIATWLPTLKGRMLLLDAGANVECRPLHLVQFALMGEVYTRRMLGLPHPKIAVLSNGEEDSKGTEMTRAASAALRAFGPDFIGYAEGKDVFSGKLDVAVTDGFNGNLLLKTAEGCAEALMELMRRSVKKSWPAMAGMLLARPALRRFRSEIDWDEYGGAPLIGVNGVGIIAHGRSGPKAIRNAIRVAAEAGAAHLGPELAAAAKKGAEYCAPRAESPERPRAVASPIGSAEEEAE
ncbi:MAG: phosphate acyltransferase PlsX [Solirubrobacterales bacterium]